MSTQDATPLQKVVGVVSVFDRLSPTPLPFNNHVLLLDWSRCTAEEKEAVLRHLPVQEPWKNLSDGETHLTMSIGRERRSFPIGRFRHLFDRHTIEEAKPLFNDYFNLCNLPFDPDYVENEVGKQMSQLDVFAFVSGDEKPIILRDVECLKRIGPTAAVSTAAWHGETCESLSRFLRVVQAIEQSRWMREPVVLEQRVKKQGDENPVAAAFPHVESFREIAPLFRQVFSRDPIDNLLNRAAEIYFQFSGCDGKRFWLKDILNGVKEHMKSPPFASPIDGISNAELFDAVLYGAGIMHATAKFGADKTLIDICNKFGDHNVAYYAHVNFKQLCGFARLATFLMRLDLSHWMQHQGFQLPIDRSRLLFGSWQIQKEQ